jgi:hypothetical protein
MSHDANGIDTQVPPSGTGCVECLASGSWWFHLRRCAQCGHVGCCDDSLNRHASKHAHDSGHPVIQSFEPGEDWFYDYRTGDVFDGPTLAGAPCHPDNQPVPGPEGAVPRNWQRVLMSRSND